MTATPTPTPEWGPFNTMTEVVDTHHRVLGPHDRDHWFDTDAAEFFGTRYLTERGDLSTDPTLGVVWFGRYFCTHERNPSGTEGYTLRRVDDNGEVSTVGDLIRFETSGLAHTAARALVRGGVS